MFLGAPFGIVRQAPNSASLWRVLINLGTFRSAVSLVPRGFITSSWARGSEAIRPRNAEDFLFSRCSTRAAYGSTAAAAAAATGDKGVTFTTTEAALRRNADEGCVAFVTGANRGIGLEVTEQLLKRTKGTYKSCK